MKTTIRLPVSPDHTFLVRAGERVENHAILAKSQDRQEEKIIPLSDILHISPKHIMRTLKKHIGTEVQTGDILAEKKNLFSALVVKSPCRAKLKEIDLTRGTLTLSPLQGGGEEKELIAPFAGKVLHITDTYIELETDGQLFKLQKGAGEAVMGELFCFSHDPVEMFDIHPDVFDKIVFVLNLTSDVLVKLDVLGIKGILFQKKFEGDIEGKTSWGQIEKEVYSHIQKQDGKTVWLQPEEKQLLALE